MLRKRTDDVDGWIVSCSYKDEGENDLLMAWPQYDDDDDPLDGAVMVRMRTGGDGESDLSMRVKDLVRFCNGCLGAIQADLASYRFGLDEEEEDEEEEDEEEEE